VRFASLGHINEQGSGLASISDFEAMMKQCIAFDEERVQSGQWLRGIGLQGPRTARTLRAKGGKVVVTDGPFAETREWLGGVVVLAFEDMDQAVGLLSKHPALRFGVGIEIRPINEAMDLRWQSLQD
jgi:hypothetical protein